MQEVFRRKAERAVVKPLKRADEQRRAEQQKHAEGRLNGHEGIRQPPVRALAAHFLQSIDQRRR